MRQKFRFLSGCEDSFSGPSEDQESYAPMWGPLQIENTTETWRTELRKAFLYQSQEDTKLLPYWGRLNSYSGAGYLASLGDNLVSARDMVRDLMASNWLTSRACAIFLEATVYNANSNLFTTVKVVVEIPRSGGFYIYDDTQTFRVYDYVGPTAILVVGAQIVWVLILLHTIFIEVTLCVKQKKKYFKQFWNLYQLLTILSSLIVCAVYPVKVIYTIQAIEALKNSTGTVPIFDFCTKCADRPGMIHDCRLVSWVRVRPHATQTSRLNEA